MSNIFVMMVFLTHMTMMFKYKKGLLLIICMELNSSIMLVWMTLSFSMIWESLFLLLLVFFVSEALIVLVALYSSLEETGVTSSILLM